MLRNSPVLVSNHYKIHKSIIRDVILNLKYNDLWNVAIDNIPTVTIQSCYNDLTNKYEEIIQKQSGTSKRKPSDTFITKIMLGTFGCVPAYDSNLKKSIRNINKKTTIIIKTSFSADNLKKLCSELKRIETNMEGCVAKFITNHKKYTEMKVLDMYLWQSGV